MSWIQSDLQKTDTPYVPPSWSTGSDEEIVEALEKHYNDEIDLTEYWNVGDERIIHLSAIEAESSSIVGYCNDSHVAQDLIFILTAIGGKELVTPINGHTTCLFQVDQKTCFNDSSEEGWLQPSNKPVNTWNDTGRKRWLDTDYKSAFPSTIVGIFKQFKNPYGYYNGATEKIGTAQEYFSLRSEIEVTGASSNSVAGEGSQVTYYLTSANRIKTYGGNNSAVQWWLRSHVNSYRSGNFDTISVSGTVNKNVTQSYKWGIAPFGVI